MPVSERDGAHEYPPRQIIVCEREGDWIEWERDRKPERGDCPFGECDCWPVLYQRAYERSKEALQDAG